MKRNVLIIAWKDYLGHNLVTCGNPKREEFKWVRSEEKAQAILNRRVRGNILSAEYNGKFLIDPPAPTLEEVVAPVTPVITPTDKTNKPGFFNKIGSAIKNAFRPKLFARQKH